eukprot:gene24256-10309_t
MPNILSMNPPSMADSGLKPLSGLNSHSASMVENGLEYERDLDRENW